MTPDTYISSLIFDIDGVLTFQGRVYPGAVETLDELRARGLHLRFLTNSTLKSRRSAAQRLVQTGFQAREEEVFTASYLTAQYLRGLNPRSCWVMLAGPGRDQFKDFVHDESSPEYLVVGDYRQDFDFDTLNRALGVLQEGAKLIGMTPELVDSSLGSLELNVGSWVELLARAAAIEPTYIGKPSPYGFKMVLETLPVPPETVLVVGDRVSSDVAGAHGVGLRAALVKTGEFDPQDLDAGPQPDYIIEELSELMDVV
jgi:HAD superfamily hydrolase (TIGR01458 family)